MIRLCALADLPTGDNVTVPFTVKGQVENFDIFVHRRGARLDIWRNACPHLGITMDWKPGQFLDSTGMHYICATHGALFRFDDGLCVSGPCRGKWLGRVMYDLRDDALWVDLPVAEAARAPAPSEA